MSVLWNSLVYLCHLSRSSMARKIRKGTKGVLLLTTMMLPVKNGVPAFPKPEARERALKAKKSSTEKNPQPQKEGPQVVSL